MHVMGSAVTMTATAISFHNSWRAHQEVVRLDIPMQGGSAMDGLHCLGHLPQDELGLLESKDQLVPVGALEAACRLPATAQRPCQTAYLIFCEGETYTKTQQQLQDVRWQPFCPTLRDQRLQTV